MSKSRSIVGDGDARQKNDFYPTPTFATEALMKREKFNGLIWEPACGDYAMSKVLEGYNEVRATDLIYGQDFFFEPIDKVPNIVTNPPYSLAEEFIERSKSVATEKIAMLLRLSFLEGKGRYHMFQDTSFPLKKVLVFCNRLNFFPVKTGAGMLAYAWYVWDRSYKGEPTVGWIK